MIYTRNNVVAVEPIKNLEAPTTKRLGGMSVQDTRVSLIPAKVVFAGYGDLADIKPGMTVYLHGELVAKSDFNRKVYTAGGVEFVLVPKDVVVMVDLGA